MLGKQVSAELLAGVFGVPCTAVKITEGLARLQVFVALIAWVILVMF